MAINNVNNPRPGIAGNLIGTGKADKAAPSQAANAYAKAASNVTVGEAANVQISSRAKEMSQIRKVINETPDVREDKVAYFKDLIAKGEYKADADKIADGILNEAIRDELANTPDVALE